MLNYTFSGFEINVTTFVTDRSMYHNTNGWIGLAPIIDDNAASYDTNS